MELINKDFNHCKYVQGIKGEHEHTEEVAENYKI